MSRSVPFFMQDVTDFTRKRRNATDSWISWGKTPRKIHFVKYFWFYINSLTVSYMVRFFGHFYSLAQGPILYYLFYRLAGVISEMAASGASYFNPGASRSRPWSKKPGGLWARRPGQ